MAPSSPEEGGSRHAPAFAASVLPVSARCAWPLCLKCNIPRWGTQQLIHGGVIGNFRSPPLYKSFLAMSDSRRLPIGNGNSRGFSSQFFRELRGHLSLAAPPMGFGLEVGGTISDLISVGLPTTWTHITATTNPAARDDLLKLIIQLHVTGCCGGGQA